MRRPFKQDLLIAILKVICYSKIFYLPDDGGIMLFAVNEYILQVKQNQPVGLQMEKRDQI